MDLDAWTRRIAAIDARLRPIADRPVRDLAALPPAPLEEANVREETEALLAVIIAEYRVCSAAEREAIRALWRAHRCFAWAASFPFEPMTAERFRDHLTLFSIADQGLDTRDAILAIAGLCESAERAGVATSSMLHEIAALSSDVDKYGMGSTRSLVLRHV